MSKKGRNLNQFDRSCPAGTAYANKELAEAASSTGRAVHCKRGRHWHVDERSRKGDRTRRRMN
jgi:hypothetical protein